MGTRKWQWHSTEHTRYLEINAKDCFIVLEPRPGYCDRGNFIAKLFVTGDARELGIDAADGWPRYYFDLGRAQLEVVAWLDKRKQ